MPFPGSIAVAKHSSRKDAEAAPILLRQQFCFQSVDKRPNNADLLHLLDTSHLATIKVGVDDCHCNGVDIAGHKHIPLPVTQVCVQKPRTASIAVLQLRTCTYGNCSQGAGV